MRVADRPYTPCEGVDPGLVPKITRETKALSDGTEPQMMATLISMTDHMAMGTLVTMSVVSKGMRSDSYWESGFIYLIVLRMVHANSGTMPEV